MKIYFDLPKISCNEFNNMHWSAKKRMRETFYEAIWYTCKKNGMQPIRNNCRINFVFRNRFDADNNGDMVKMIVDGLRYAKIIKDDNKKYFTGYSVDVGDQDYFEIIENNA
jgi:hypothetical protein